MDPQGRFLAEQLSLVPRGVLSARRRWRVHELPLSIEWRSSVRFDVASFQFATGNLVSARGRHVRRFIGLLFNGSNQL